MKRQGCCRSVAAVAIVMTLTGCSESNAGVETAITPRATNADVERVPPSAPPDDGGAGNYVVPTDESISLQEGIDPLPDDPRYNAALVGAAWYAEYGTSLGSLTVFGYLKTFENLAADLNRMGFTLTSSSIARWASAGVANSVDPNGPAIVAIGEDTTAFVLLSYDVPGEALIDLAKRFRRADQSEWTAAGGVVLTDYETTPP